jgi:orotidine-5'-phosphate decarboxylase
MFASPFAALDMAKELGEIDESGYTNIGAVISGLFPHNAFREYAPNIFFLIPGLGVQGGQPQDQLTAFKDHNGAILSYSRAVLYPSGDGIWEDKIINTVKSIINEIKELWQKQSNPVKED